MSFDALIFIQFSLQVDNGSKLCRLTVAYMAFAICCVSIPKWGFLDVVKLQITLQRRWIVNSLLLS